MSLWIIDRVSEKVKLTYTREPFAERPLVQDCGEADAALEIDVEAFVFEEAEPWDLVRTPRGTFVRQRDVVQDGSRAADSGAIATMIA